MEIKNMEGITADELKKELECGAKFVIYQYCVSIVIMTFKRSSDIYFVRGGESGVGSGMIFSVISLLFGWWGIPWGPIYTIQSFYYNFKGGKDITQEVLASMAARVDQARQQDLEQEA